MRAARSERCLADLEPCALWEPTERAGDDRPGWMHVPQAARPRYSTPRWSGGRSSAAGRRSFAISCPHYWPTFLVAAVALIASIVSWRVLRRALAKRLCESTSFNLVRVGRLKTCLAQGNLGSPSRPCAAAWAPFPCARNRPLERRRLPLLHRCARAGRRRPHAAADTATRASRRPCCRTRRAAPARAAQTLIARAQAGLLARPIDGRARNCRRGPRAAHQGDPHYGSSGLSPSSRDGLQRRRRGRSRS